MTQFMVTGSSEIISLSVIQGSFIHVCLDDFDYFDQEFLIIMRLPLQNRKILLDQKM